MNEQREKVVSLDQLLARLAEHRRCRQAIVFTNGCFDVLHVGHIRLLDYARRQGDLLVAAINSDASVRSMNKGADRPIHPERERAEVLAAFAAVDYVVIFDEPTPLRFIERIRPDVLVKGGDWAENAIVGRETVEAYGGSVLRMPPVPGQSSTNIIEKIKSGTPR